MNTEVFLSVANPGAFLGSAVLGGSIGAFYGYRRLALTDPPVYPAALWLVGVAYLVVTTLALVFLQDDITPRFPLESALARGLLWTTLCGSIPIGRYLRSREAMRRLRKRRKKLEGRAK
jgi:hypothetical protein